MKRFIANLVGLLLVTGLWTTSAWAGVNYIQYHEAAMAEKGTGSSPGTAEGAKHFMHTSRYRAEQVHALPRTDVTSRENPTIQGYERPNVEK